MQFRSAGAGATAAGGSRPATSSGRPASAAATYRIVCSSEDSLSDGELHVERREGSMSAWYQHGTSGTGGSPRRGGHGETGSSIDADGVHASGGSLTVVLHDRTGDGCSEDVTGSADRGDPRSGGRGAGGKAALMPGQQEGAVGVSWESNNLFDYLKGLHEAEAVALPEMESEEWARRIAKLRQLLRERDGEVAELQKLLEERASELEGRAAELAKQARRIAELEQRIAELEQRIRLLASQLAAAQQAAAPNGGSTSRELAIPRAHISAHSGDGEFGVGYTGQKRPLAAAAATYSPAPADSYFLQLPVQSYAEHQGCGFWQNVLDSVHYHPRRWGAAAAALLLLLLIVLCATLIPASRRRSQRPAFLEPPSAVAAGASWVDLAVRVDRPGLLSYMAFRQADLNSQVPGLGRTLLELIQEEEVKAGAVYAASAPSYSLDPLSSAPQPGLQHLAVACGWAPIADASKDGSQPAARVSVLSVSGGASSACTAAAASAPGRCSRCPKLEDGTAYTLLLVASARRGGALSGVQVVNAVTGDSSLNVNAVEPPFADNATANSFTLHAKLNVPGTMYFAVAYDQLYAPFGASQLVFGQLTPPASAVISANPAAFTGGLVANGSVAVPTTGEWVNITVQPPCVAALCTQGLWGLQAGTAYRVYIVAVDAYGNADPAPAVAAVTTAPATSAPALLPATQPANVTDSGFGVTVSQDAVGGVYFLLALAKPGTATSGADVVAGNWSQVPGLAPSRGRRRLAALPAVRSASLHSTAHQQPHWQRQLLAGQAAAPGSLVAPTCYPANRTCTLAATSAFSSVAGLADGFQVVASGCVPVPAAGQALTLPPFSSLQNNTLYHLLLATEDLAVPEPRRLQTPAVYAIHTVDLSAPRLACGFPVATNITASGFTLSTLLTKPGESVFYVVLPTAAAAASPPSALEVLRGTASGGGSAAAAGNLTQWGSLPWEATSAANRSADARKLWAAVGGLQGGTSYTAFLTLTTDGNMPVPGAPVAVLSGIMTPSVVAPTFTRLSGLNASVNELNGTFAVQLSAVLDRPGQVFYSLYRNYSCIKGEPSVADIVSGNPLPTSICTCQDATYCARVTTGNFSAPTQGQAAVHTVGGDLSPLPFQSLRNATEDKLKCFQGGLGQATDTYNIYMVAGNVLPTFTGLAPHCSNFAQAAVAAATATSGGSIDGTCPAAPQLACVQAQLRPDSQTLQSGALLAWGTSTNSTSGSGSGSGGNSSSSVEWQVPTGVSASGRPAKVQLSLEGGAAPAFTMGPVYPAELRNGSSFGVQFALDKPALLIYAVFRPLPMDATGTPQAPVLIATGRVPVFDAAVNATTGPITACSWAPGGAMQPQSQYFLQFVARDKYGRMDGLCPGQQAGSAPRVCTDLALTGG